MAKRHRDETSSPLIPCKQARLESLIKPPLSPCLDPQALQEQWAVLKENDFYKEFMRLLMEAALNVVPASSSSSTRSDKKKSGKSVTWAPLYQKKTSDYIVHLPYEYTKLNTLRETDNDLILSAIHKDTLDYHVVRRLELSNITEIKRAVKSLVLHRCLQNPNVNRPCKVYVKDGFLYSIQECLDSELREVVDDRTTHHCVAKVMHQLLSLLKNMHESGFSHGDITLTSASMNADITVQVVDYGHVKHNGAAQQWADVDACREILAHFLLEEESCHSLQNGLADLDNLEWKPILESTAETGLTDVNARDFLMVMGEAASCSSLLDHEYLSCFQRKRETSLLERLIQLTDENRNPEDYESDYNGSKPSLTPEELGELIKRINHASEEEILEILNSEIGLLDRHTRISSPIS